MERPIILKAHEVRGILDGRQTQLRRIAKFRQSAASTPFENGTSTDQYRNGYVVQGRIGSCWNDLTEPLPCPFGKVGDRLWVRETWAEVNDHNFSVEGYQYRATGKPLISCAKRKWSPSINMPRCASRILLEIVSVRVERLQDISEADAFAQGMEKECFNQVYAFSWREPFKRLWQEIYGSKSWDANPWVWVIEFKRVEPA